VLGSEELFGQFKRKPPALVAISDAKNGERTATRPKHRKINILNRLLECSGRELGLPPRWRRCACSYRADHAREDVGQSRCGNRNTNSIHIDDRRADELCRRQFSICVGAIDAANSEAGTTQTVLEALAAILDAAGRVMRRKKTATHFRAAKYQSWGGLCSEGTNNVHRVYGRLMTWKLAGPVRPGLHARPFEHKFAGLLAADLTFVDSLASLFRQLEPGGLPALVLSDLRPIDRVSARQLAIDGQIEHRQIARPSFDLQLGPDRPDVLWPERRPLPRSACPDVYICSTSRAIDPEDFDS
jgi:hypothetical protein